MCMCVCGQRTENFRKNRFIFLSSEIVYHLRNVITTVYSLCTEVAFFYYEPSTHIYGNNHTKRFREKKNC